MGEGSRSSACYCNRPDPIHRYNLKEIADYTGTSVQMIETNYCGQTLDPQRIFSNRASEEDREMIERYPAKSRKDLASPTGFEPVLSA